MGLASRVLIAGIALVGIHLGVWMFCGDGRPPEVRLPNRDLREMPTRFGRWNGKEIPQAPEILRATGAVVAIDRRYRDDVGHEVALYCAIWDEYELPHGVHRPEICYLGEGYRIVSQKDVQLQGPDQLSFPARLLMLERDGMFLRVLYWYQIGDRVAITYGDLRQAYLSLLGEPTWPPMIKVMLQTSAADPDRDSEQLRSIAELVFEWTREVQ